MITDEQVRIACKAFYDKYIQLDCCCDEELQVIRRTLEAYEQSKWIEFDVNDETTHPKDNQLCSVVYHTGQVCTDKWSVMPKSWVYASCPNYVTHWQPLPKFKE